MDIEKKPVPSAKSTEFAVDTLLQACHSRAYNNGWWHNPQTGEFVQRPVPELLCLIHSEISEALEGFRKDLKDDHLPQFDMLTVELADAMIRIADMAKGYDLPLAAALNAKLEYNDRRADHKPENRAKEGGKKI